MGVKAKERNQLLNIIESILTYFVVFIHFPFPGDFGSLIVSFARISVPFYFAVSGYFLFKNDKNAEISVIPKKIIRLIKNILISELAYFLFYLLLQIKNLGFSFQCIVNIYNGEFLGYYVQELPKRLMVLFPVFNGTAWFMTSLIAVYLIYYLAIRFSFTRIIEYISPVLIFAGMILFRIFVKCNILSELPWERILLFLPIPFFSLGYNMHRFKDKIVTINSKISLSIIIAGIVLTAIEQHLFSEYPYTLYIGTLLCVVGIFILFINMPSYQIKTPIGRFLSYIAGKRATWVYLFHMLVGWVISPVIEKVSPSLSSNVIFEYAFPLIVCVGVTVFSIIFESILNLINKIFKKICK